MAVTFSLTSTGLTTIDFTSGTDFSLQEDLYGPTVAAPTGDGSIPPYVTETLPVMVRATSDDDLADSLQDLAALQKRAAEYWVNQQQTTPVWLGCKLDLETAGRQALVKSIDFAWRPDIHGLYRECNVPPNWLLGTVLIERHPYWERTSGRTFPNATPAAAASVAYDYTAAADLVGDVPARVNALAVRWAAGTTPHRRLWMGIRSTTLHGAAGVTGFILIWEMESGSLVATDAARDAASEQDTASPGGILGSFVQVTEAVEEWDNTWNTVLTITLNQAGYAGGNEARGFGRFLWLLRAKVGAGTWEVRLRTAYAYGRNYTDPVEVSNTSWDYHEMAVFDLPARNFQAIDGVQLGVAAETQSTIYVQAQRTSGAGDLMLDCLCPIPVDEGFLKMWNADAINLYEPIFGQGPSEVAQAVAMNTNTADIADLYSFEYENFRLPPGDGRIICVYASSAASVLTDQIEFADPTYKVASYTERWTALRGAE